jgi:hypothetical protein
LCALSCPTFDGFQAIERSADDGQS